MVYFGKKKIMHRGGVYSVIFEYLENQLPAWCIVSVWIWTCILSWGYLAVRQKWTSLCTVWSSYSPLLLYSFSWLIQFLFVLFFFFAKHHITQICRLFLQPRFGTLALSGFFPKCNQHWNVVEKIKENMTR